MSRRRWYWSSLVFGFAASAFMLLTQTSLAAPPSTLLTDTEMRLLLDVMLNMPNVVGPTTDRDKLNTSLARYRQMTELRLRYYRDRQATREHLKAYLFIVFVSDAANSAHSIEEIAKNEILNVFRSSSQDVLSVLKERPFLVPVVCRLLNEHFELFGDGKDRKRFVEQYGSLIAEALGKTEVGKCEGLQ